MKQLEKDNKLTKQSSILAHEATLCPVINFTKKVAKVIDDEGKEIMNDFEDNVAQPAVRLSYNTEDHNSVTTSELTESPEVKSLKTVGVKRQRPQNDETNEKIEKLLSTNNDQLMEIEIKKLEMRQMEIEAQRKRNLIEDKRQENMELLIRLILSKSANNTAASSSSDVFNF